jgi:hypothetical protein
VLSVRVPFGVFAVAVLLLAPSLAKVRWSLFSKFKIATH